jgi:Flp pilus assembly protein TadG
VMTRARRLAYRSCQRGSVAIEYAFVFPVLVLFLFGIIDTGRLLWTYTTLHRASEAAARCYAIQAAGCTTSGATQIYAVAQAWGLAVTSSAFTVSSPACGMQVVASYNFVFVIPWFYIAPPLGSSNSIALTATACFPT